MSDRQPRTLARFQGASVEHRLAEADGTVTRCGKDATFAHRYPFLTQANSTDRRPWRRCSGCEAH